MQISHVSLFFLQSSEKPRHKRLRLLSPLSFKFCHTKLKSFKLCHTRLKQTHAVSSPSVQSAPGSHSMTLLRPGSLATKGCVHANKKNVTLSFKLKANRITISEYKYIHVYICNLCGHVQYIYLFASSC